MPFPSSGLPNAASLYGTPPTSRNADGDRVLAPSAVFEGRPCRMYRDRAVESSYIREGSTVDGVVALRYEDGDVISPSHTIVIDGTPYDVVYARRMDTWSRPSHWEIVIRRTA